MIYSQKPSILILDDNLTDATWLEEVLIQMGFPNPFVSYDVETAASIIISKNPEIVICDLFFDGKPQGLALLNQFSTSGQQFIVTTSSQESTFYEQTRAIGAKGHLIKPFHPLTLRSMLDHLVSPTILPLQSAHLFIRGTQNRQIRVNLKEILFLYSERNYTFIKTLQGRFTIKRSLSKMQEELDDRFIRVHNSYIINTDFLKAASTSTVLIDKDIIPLGRAYRKNLTSVLNPDRDEKSKVPLHKAELISTQ